jgi:hypothetical protein
MPESDDEILRRIDELRKDPKRWKEYIESRLDRAVKSWRKR